MGDKPIPGPDPGACPDCGGWRKAGMRHNCAEERERLADLARELYEAAKESDRLNLSHDSLYRARVRYEQECLGE